MNSLKFQSSNVKIVTSIDEEANRAGININLHWLCWGPCITIKSHYCGLKTGSNF